MNEETLVAAAFIGFVITAKTLVGPMIVKWYDDYKTNFIRFVRRFASIFGLPDFKLNALTTIMRYTVSRTRPRMRTYTGASWSWKDFPWKKSR